MPYLVIGYEMQLDENGKATRLTAAYKSEEFAGAGAAMTERVRMRKTKPELLYKVVKYGEK